MIINRHFNLRGTGRRGNTSDIANLSKRAIGNSDGRRAGDVQGRGFNQQPGVGRAYPGGAIPLPGGLLRTAVLHRPERIRGELTPP